MTAIATAAPRIYHAAERRDIRQRSYHVFLQVYTGQLTGTNDWTPVEKKFTVPPAPT